MDDWIVLADIRWKLRRAVKTANEALERLKVQKHPFKTSIGRIRQGFDFMGYRMTPESAAGLEVAWQTMNNHYDKFPSAVSMAKTQKERHFVKRAGLTLFYFYTLNFVN
jgi:hypothetical protein